MSVTFKDLQNYFETLEDDKAKEINIDIKGEVYNIKVRSYVPSYNINEAIDEIISQSFINGRFSPVRSTIATQLAIILLFTDIRFTKKEQEKIYTVYDVFESLGLFQKIIDAIGEQEYTNFMKLLNESIQMEIKYRNTFLYAANNFMLNAPKAVQDGVKVMEQIDPNKLETLMKLYNNAGK